MAKCSKCGSPVCKCGPLHYSDSPVKQVGVVYPNTGMPIAPAQQMTNVPPQQANTLGTAQPVFKPQAQQLNVFQNSSKILPSNFFLKLNFSEMLAPI